MQKHSAKKEDSTNPDTIMVICAHPDDEILGAGGTIAKYSRQGKKVITIIFSYGEQSHWWLKKGFTAKMRMKEAKAAAKIVGTSETIFLGLKDFELKEEFKDKNNLMPLKKLIRKHNPSKILTHSPDDIIYSDHKAVWDFVDKVTDDIHYSGDIYVFNIWAQDIRLGRNPKLFVDISDTFKLKLRALKCFKSQKLALFQLLPGIIWDAFKAAFGRKCRFGESFTKVK